MKKLLTLALVFGLSVVAIGCGGGSSSAPKAGTSGSTTPDSKK